MPSSYKKNINVSSINTGTKIPIDQSIYPKKPGILTPFSSAMDLTIKLGALPIYVPAPINTAPQDIAVRSFTVIIPALVVIPFVNPNVPAVVKNTRYVGVLSRKLQSAPVVQNICHALLIPSVGPTALRIIRAGCIVINIPIKSTATS